MPSYPRCYLLGDDSTFHITWQCHNGKWLLKSGWAKKLYYDLLLKFKEEYRIQIYSYNLMDSHPHLTGRGESQVEISNFMKRVNGIFARAYNRQVKRRGQVIMDRFRSSLIESDEHLLTVMSYIDLNPVRAKMVPHPSEYHWTSYPYYAFGLPDRLLTPAPSYLALGDTARIRQQAYQNLIADLMAQGLSKRNYSKAYFIGHPDWVMQKHQELVKAHKRTLKPPELLETG